jgi:hypothetical protein
MFEVVCEEHNVFMRSQNFVPCIILHVFYTKKCDRLGIKNSPLMESFSFANLPANAGNISGELIVF